MMSVPKGALLKVDGTQYLSMPGSRYGFTSTTLVPSFLASCRYLVATGCALAGFAPKKMIRSVPNQSLKLQVEAATPRACFIAAVLGEWQSRAALSMLFVPRKRATFCAT